MTEQLREELPPVAPPYERTRWEAAVLAEQMHYREIAVALILAHHAGPGGILAENGIQRTERMRKLVKIAPVSVRQALNSLQGRGLLQRLPHSPGATRAAARGIALTVPVRRERPPHPEERP
ncbi:hypothetical protein [Streptomyces scabiei]|uniref:hypothetical protein n=1 Tax=Streptomyces scabiei TaxID=1930 RepID=UPI0007661BF7|nr:hypothetical protein [Streptomyces scabiei]